MTSEEIGDALAAWREKPSSLLIPQFLSSHGLSQIQLERACIKDMTCQLELDRTLALLATRIADILLTDPKIASSKEKVLLKYLFRYDQDLEKRDIAARTAIGQKEMEHAVNFLVEHYGSVKLDTPYDRLYKPPGG